MGNSSLVDYKRISPNKSVPRNHEIDTITIHCMEGQLTAETCGEVFAEKNRCSSSNYGVGKDGRIGLYVEEKDRSWCSSNEENDNRAITIEVASDRTHPYKVTDAAYKATIRLVADICKRNGIKKLIWSDDKNARINHLNGVNMTVHRDFDNKTCPGEYLYTHMKDIAEQVNKLLNNSDGGSKPTNTYIVKVKNDILEVRKGPGNDYPVVTKVKKGDVYTIVKDTVKDNVKWGYLKSGVGWIGPTGTEINKK